MAASENAVMVEGALTSGGLFSELIRRSLCRHFCGAVPGGTCDAQETSSSLSWRDADTTQYQRKNTKKIFSHRVVVEKGHLTGWSSFLVILWKGRG